MARVKFSQEQLDAKGIKVRKFKLQKPVHTFIGDPVISKAQVIDAKSLKVKEFRFDKLVHGVILPKTMPEYVIKHIIPVIDQARANHIIKENTTAFFITPMAAPRMTRGQVKMVHIDDSKLDKAGLAKKHKIIEYENFKQALALMANQKKFVLPDQLFRVYFYIPMPGSWSEKKKKDMWGTPHQVKPDADNLMKAVKDALRKDDKKIWDAHYTKYWDYNGRIEIQIKQENHTP